jgi:Phytanoyl-CoA dioxygenase (PhyH)
MRRTGFFQHGEQDSDASADLLSRMRVRREQALAAGRPARGLAGEEGPDKTLWDRLGDGLTAAQRVHLETLGFAVVPEVLSADEVGQLLTATYDLEEAHRERRTLPEPCWVEHATREYFRANNIIHVHPSFLEYVSKPAVVAMAEHAVGLRPRLVESEVHIRRAAATGSEEYDFHRGTWFDGSIVGGWYRFPMVKALTFLTDVGPDDGGTAVIAGSHKLPVDSDLQYVADTALASPALISTICAPAGSTLLFFESLIHSSGIIRSGRDRVVVIAGYAPMMFQPVSGHEPQGELLSRLPADYCDLVDGARTYLP